MKKTVLLTCLTATLLGLPQKMQVISGEAKLSQQDSKCVIHCSDKTFLEWNQFSIGKNEMVRFMQQGADSLAVNRVTGNEASHIMGQLIANGNVYLINPQGILIGPDATIVANTFLATTIDAASEEILKNKEILFQGSTGFIDQQGLIETKEGVFLISPKIEESGTLRGEHVALAGSTKVLFSPHKRQKIYLSFEVDEGEIDHKGSIEALCTEMKASGAHAKAISSTGTITTVKKEAGAIYIVADKGRTTFDGTIKAPSASVHLLAEERVTLGDNALIDVSSTSPGEILIGGDYKGQNPEILNASFNHVKPGAKLLANNLHKGDGGKIVVWADEKTLYQGHLESKGGPNGGNGGFAEVSGKIDLGFLGTVDMTAAEGKSGQLLLDPQDIIITAAGVDPAVDYFFDNTGGTININVANLESALMASSITLQANRDFLWNTASGMTVTSSNDLNIAAGRDIRFSFLTGTISLNGGSLTMRINDQRADPAFRTAGDARYLFPGGIFSTNGGDIRGTVGTFGGVKDGSFTSGFIRSIGEGMFAGGGDISFEVEIFSNTIAVFFGAQDQFVTTGDGNITFRGTATNTTANPVITSAIKVADGALFQTENGDIELTAIGESSGIANKFGIFFIDGATFTTQTGNITYQATLTDVGAGSQSTVLEENVFNVNSGTLTINGTISGSTDGNVAVRVRTAASATGNGTITLTAINNATGNDNFGFDLDDDFPIGGNNITINGTGGTGADNCRGVNFNAGDVLSSTTGNITINSVSRGTGNNNQGILYNAGNLVTTTSGNITFRGTAGPNESDDILLTNGVNLTTGGSGIINIFTTGKDCTITNGAVTSTGTGDINFNVARDLFLTAGTAGEDAQIQITNGGSNGDILIKAGRDIQLQSIDGAQAEITNAGSGDVTLVVDNAFPEFPDYGEGRFVNDFSNTSITTNGQLRIYTVDPGFNLIGDQTINGGTFTYIMPSDVGINGNQAVYRTYFPFGGYPGGAFVFYYKTPLEVPFSDAVIRAGEIALAKAQSGFFGLTSPFITYNVNLNYVSIPCDPANENYVCSDSPYDYFYIDSVWNLIRKNEME
jgi:filamentous hemagglutinin family protein